MRVRTSGGAKATAKMRMKIPATMFAPPVLAPNRYIAASPPAPWHIGNPPSGVETRFMAPIVRESRSGSTPFFGKRS